MLSFIARLTAKIYYGNMVRPGQIIREKTESVGILCSLPCVLTLPWGVPRSPLFPSSENATTCVWCFCPVRCIRDPAEGLSPRYPLPSTYQNSRLPEGKAGVQNKSHCLHKPCRHREPHYQLTVSWEYSEAEFSDASQGPTFLTGLSKDSNPQPFILILFCTGMNELVCAMRDLSKPSLPYNENSRGPRVSLPYRHTHCLSPALSPLCPVLPTELFS